ncbi:NAD(P)-dependent oxidoreductase [Agathobacter sp.]
MKVIITDYPDVLKRDLDYEIRIIKENIPSANVEVLEYREYNSWIEGTKDADALLTAFLEIGAREMDEMQKLKCISVNATGYATIDLEAAKKRNIVVKNVNDYCTNEVADHTMALILALERGLKLYQNDIDIKNRWQYNDFKYARRIQGQVLGICGLGKIGRVVVKRAKVFGMRTIAYSPHCMSDEAAKLGVRLVDKDTLLAESDIISNHMAQSSENYHFFDYKAFCKMKRNVIFVNVGRGAAVKEDDLVRALDEGKILAAGLDVLEEENPKLLKSELINRENVIITPHAAFYSQESLRDLQTISCMNLVESLTR